MVDEVITSFLDEVEKGNFKYGERLPSQESLAKYFDVSRIVLREAFSRLSASGMITFKQGKGTYLHKAELAGLMPKEFSRMFFGNVDNIYSIIEARKIIEKETSRLAAMRRTPENLKEIESTIVQMQSVKDNPITYAKWDLEFHLAVAKASQNIVLQQILHVIKESYWDEMLKVFGLPDTISTTSHDHQQIYEAIKAGNSKQAFRLMESHLSYSENIASEMNDKEK